MVLIPIWVAKIPNKVKIFGWKACQNILHTKMNLFFRKITDDLVFEECGSAQKQPYITCAVSVQEGTGGILARSREFTDILWQLMV